MSPFSSNGKPLGDAADSNSEFANGTAGHGDTAIAMFYCCEHSHPFETRRLLLTEKETKIGRAVARLKPFPDNAVFDCKVLSRNHAVIWYSDGKFYLKDTKSSNGTFVNSTRLSRASEESEPYEVFSADIVQLGVEIEENAKKLTHGCIMGIIRLYHPNGQEQSGRPSEDKRTNVEAPTGPAVQNSALASGGAQELYRLQQYLKEAAHRESVLEQKLATLQALLLSTGSAAGKTWQALIDEDRLLSRIECLELQLQAYSKNSGTETLRAELTALLEEKHSKEIQAKEALRKALDDKIEALQKLRDVELSLENTEEELTVVRDERQCAQEELDSVMEKHARVAEEFQDCSHKLEKNEAHCNELEDAVNAKQAELEAKMKEAGRQETVLTAKVSSLQTDNDLCKEKMAAMQLRINTLSATCEKGDSLSVDERVQKLTEQLTQAHVQLDSYKNKLDASELLADQRQVLLNVQAAKIEQLQSRLDASGDIGLLQSPNNLELIPPPPTPPRSEASPDDDIETQLARANQRHQLAETELTTYKAELEQSRTRQRRLQKELDEALIRNKSETEKSANAVAALVEQLEQARKYSDVLKGQCTQLQSQLDDSNRAATAELTLAKEKIKSLQEEVEFERSLRSTSTMDDESARITLHRQAAKNQAEFAMLKDECSKLKTRICAIEKDMKTSKRENSRISAEYRRLQDSYRELEVLKDSLEAQHGLFSEDLSDVRGENDVLKFESDRRRDGLDDRGTSLECVHQALEQSMTQSAMELNMMGLGVEPEDGPYEELTRQTKLVALFSSVPLVLLALAIVLAYLPFFSILTSTTDPPG